MSLTDSSGIRLGVPNRIAAVITELLDERWEVWLIGSQANREATEQSDWDFLAFGDCSTLKRLAQEPPIHGLDLLIVVDGDKFLSPWHRAGDGTVKSGRLQDWRWCRQSNGVASYESTKFPVGAPEPTVRTCAALRVESIETGGDSTMKEREP